VIQEGDRIIAINGQYLEGRTMDEIYGFIAESPVKMLLTVEFRVAGMSKSHQFLLSNFNFYYCESNILICFILHFASCVLYIFSNYNIFTFTYSKTFLYTRLQSQ